MEENRRMMDEENELYIERELERQQLEIDQQQLGLE